MCVDPKCGSLNPDSALLPVRHNPLRLRLIHKTCSKGHKHGEKEQKCGMSKTAGMILLTMELVWGFFYLKKCLINPITTIVSLLCSPNSNTCHPKWKTKPYLK